MSRIARIINVNTSTVTCEVPEPGHQAGLLEERHVPAGPGHLRYRSVDKGLQTVAAVDEAQYLSADILRDPRMLANFDTGSRDCLTLVLACS